MQIRKWPLGLGIALWMVACSRTPLPMPRDAAVEAQPSFEVHASADLVPSDPDATLLAPDGSVPDAAVPDGVAREVAVADVVDATVPDGVAREAAVADLADVFAHEVKTSDSATADAAAPDVRDTAGPDLAASADAREVSTNPFAGRSFRIDDMNPAPTPDPTCTPSRPVSSAEFTVSADLTSMTGTASSGSIAWQFSAAVGPEASKLTYHVSNLTGGRVFLEVDQGVYVAQIALYGSGVPVMWCLRGALTPQP